MVKCLRSCWYVALLSVFTFGSKGQSLDSLLQLLSVPSLEDTASVNRYIEVGNEIHTTFPELTLRFAEKTLEASERLDYVKGIAEAKKITGLSHWIQSNYEPALEALFSAYNSYESIEDNHGIAKVNNNIGIVYNRLGQLEKALSYFNEALSIYENISDDKNLAATLNNIGVTYRQLDKPDSSLIYYNKSLNIRRKINDQKGISASYNNIALIHYRHFDNPALAIDYYSKALKIKEELNDLYGLSNTYLNLVNIHYEAGNLQEAQTLAEKGISLADSVGSKRLLRYHAYRLYEIASDLKQFDKAISLLKKYYNARIEELNESNSDEIAKLELKHELDQKTNELSQARQELELSEARAALAAQRRNLLIATIIFIVIVGFVFVRWLIARNSLTKTQLENSRLKESELQRELDLKTKQVTSYALNFIQKNELIADLNAKINEIKERSDDSTARELNKMNRIVNNSLKIDQDWENFKLMFEEIHDDFFGKLKSQYPGLGNSEYKLCALLRLNLSVKEAAQILGISSNSVKTARYRLRRKFELKREENLVDFLVRFHDESSVLQEAGV